MPLAYLQKEPGYWVPYLTPEGANRQPIFDPGDGDGLMRSMKEPLRGDESEVTAQLKQYTSEVWRYELEDDDQGNVVIALVVPVAESIPMRIATSTEQSLPPPPIPSDDDHYRPSLLRRIRALLRL